jgi:hypothetical protein
MPAVELLYSPALAAEVKSQTINPKQKKDQHVRFGSADLSWKRRGGVGALL